MQVKCIAESAILSTFIKLPFVIKIFVLSIFEWPFYTGLLYMYNVTELSRGNAGDCSGCIMVRLVELFASSNANIVMFKTGRHINDVVNRNV